MNISDIDLIMVVSFLVFNLIAGIYSGRGIKDIKDYAVSDRNFSTSTISATIIATWISGSYFTVAMSQAYQEGVWFLPAAAASVLGSIIVMYFFAPKMGEFFGSISVAESMGKMFGPKVRFITALCSVAQAIGMTALQIRVFSTVFSHFFGFSSVYATVVSSAVVIFYSAWGGIKAVTFTDKIQFLTFAIFIPLFFMFVWKVFGDVDAIAATVQTNQLLDYTQLVNIDHPKFWPSFMLFIWFLIPGFDSATFQRMLMAKSTAQIKRCFGFASLGEGTIIALTCGIAIVMLSVNQNLDSSNILMHILDNYSVVGLKGLTIIGIVAMVMSTADSWINTSSVVFSHDICAPNGIKFKNELLLSRLFAIVVGIGGLIMALHTQNLFGLFLVSFSLYMPIVTPPLFMAILGFRSSSKAVLIGMFGGAAAVMLWKFTLEESTGIDAIIPGMLMNWALLFLVHYVGGQPGGWIKFPSGRSEQIGGENKEFKSRGFLWHKFFWDKTFNDILKVNILEHCTKNLPKNEMQYVYFAFAVVMTTTMNLLFLDKHTYQDHITFMSWSAGVTLLISSMFMFRKLWFVSVKNKYMGLIWYVSIFITLHFITTLLSILSKFSQVSLIIWLVNLTITGLLVNWRSMIGMTLSGVVLAQIFFQNFVGDTPDIRVEMSNIKHNIIYSLLVLGALLIAIMKSRQEREELMEEMKEHLEGRLENQAVELHKSNDLKNEFLRNLQHEAHTPITGITTMGQILWENYDKLTESQKRQAVKDISDSSVRLSSFIDSLIDLSKLSSMTYKLTLEKLDLSSLLMDRIEICKRIYLNDKDINFMLDIDKNIIINADIHYMEATFDHLITNAIQYSSGGKIEVSLKKEKDMVEFAIKDEGIGIPKNELYDIFSAFTVSSKTHSKSGGRGIGLTVAKKVIEAHGGTIWAESNGSHGAKFIFKMPQ